MNTYIVSVVTANLSQPTMRKAEVTLNLGYDHQCHLLYFTTGYYTLLPTTAAIHYRQLLYLTVTLPAIRRKCHAPRHYRFKLCLGRVFAPLWQYGQKIKKVSVNIKTVSFGCFDDAHNCRTCICALFGVAEQKVFSVYDIRLDRSLGKIVGHFHIGIVKKQVQLFFLILGIGDRLAKVRALARSKGIYDLICFVEQRLYFFLPHFKYLLSCVFSLLC